MSRIQDLSRCLKLIRFEGLLFLRLGEYGRFSTIFFVVLFNLFFGAILYLAGLGTYKSTVQGVLPVEASFYLIYLFSNSVFILTVPFGLMEAYAIFYRKTDVETLFPAPVKEEIVLLSKMIWLSLSMSLYMLFPFMMYFLPLHGFLCSLTYLALIISLFSMVLLGCGVASALCLLTSRMLTPEKLKKLASFLKISAIVTAISFVFMYFPKFVADPSQVMDLYMVLNQYSFISPASLSYLFVLAVNQGNKVAMVFLALLALINFTVYFSVFLYGKKTYFAILTEYQLVGEENVNESFLARFFKRALKPFVNEKTLSFIVNEARFTSRETFRIVNLFSTGLVIIFPGIMQFSGAPPSLMVILVLSMLSFIIGTTASQSLGYEGKPFQLIQASPVNSKEIILGKFLFYLILVWLINIFLASLIFFLGVISFFQLILFLSITLFASAGIIGFSMWVAARFPNFRGETTGLMGTKIQGTTTFGAIVFAGVISIFYFIPLIITWFFVELGYLPPVTYFFPSLVTLFLGLFSLNSSFRELERVEIT